MSIKQELNLIKADAIKALDSLYSKLNKNKYDSYRVRINKLARRDYAAKLKDELISLTKIQPEQIIETKKAVKKLISKTQIENVVKKLKNDKIQMSQKISSSLRKLVDKTKSDIIAGIKTTFDFSNKAFSNSKQRSDILKELASACQNRNNLSGSKSKILTKTINENGTQFQTVNDEFLKRLEDSAFGALKHSNQTKSDLEYNVIIQNGEGEIEFSSIDYSESTNKMDNGAFFKYYNSFPMDLSRYGVFKNFDQSNYDNTCLVDALVSSGLSDEKYSTLISSLKSREIPICKLPEICELIDIQINLKKASDKSHVKQYGKSDDQYNIGLIDNHFFINEDVEITSFAVKNALEICHLDGWRSFYKIKDGKYKKDSSKYITSFNLIELLLENKDKFLKQITIEDIEIASTQFYNSVDQTIHNLVEVDIENKNLVRKVKFVDKEKDEKKSLLNVFFDFETHTNHKKVHVPYLCRYITDLDSDSKVFLSKNCGKLMIKDIVDNLNPELFSGVRLIAHNAGYDFNFIIRHLYRVQCIYRGSHLISASGIVTSFRKDSKHVFRIEVKDSYNMIASPLRDFPGMFGLESIKEVMPYDLYNIQGKIDQRYVSIEYALTFLKEKDHKQFIENIKKWNLEQDGKFDIIEYSSKYCDLDCKILRSGYNTFRTWMKEITALNIDKYLTLPSISDAFLIKQGCYEDVYELSGIPNRFIQGSVVGGRTMTCRNEMQIFESEQDPVTGEFSKMQDFDGVSLYPSAMHRMEGFLKGIPKLIKNLDYEHLKNFDGYFVDILITKVGKNLDFPLASIKNEDGIRNFTNDLVGKEIRVDKVSLEDLIEFQKIEFKVLRGYYFDDGFNPKIKDEILTLFNKRLEMKKIGNKIEVVYKLLLNSAYGKNIMKAITEKLDIIDGEENFKKFVYRHYNWVKEVVEISDSDKYKIKSIKPTNTHFSRPHVGVMVLSWSKRIMNEVMCTAQDNGIKLYYQDTDSMHLEEKHITTLEKAFFDKYGRELIGTKLGQFHSDFEMKLYNEDGSKKKFKDIHAVKSIFLGKKSYIDVLQGTNILTGEIETDYHIRMKGIPNSTIKYVCEKYNKTPYEIYQLHYKGKVIDYDLTEKGSKANFKTSSGFSVSTLDHFTRYITYDDEIRKSFNKYKDEVNSNGKIVDILKFNSLD